MNFFYDNLEGSAEDVLSARYRDWCCGLRCMAHVGSSSIKWGLSAVMSEQLLDDIHMSIKSCRNSADGLHAFISEMVQTLVRFEDAGDSEGARRQFWTCLGVPADLVDWMCVVDPRWHSERHVLIVRPCVAGLPDASAQVEKRVAFLMQWRNWSDTRWAAVGPSSRLMVASLVGGLEGLVGLLHRKGKHNQR